MTQKFTDTRLKYLSNMYIEYKSHLDLKLITQVEFDQKIEDLESQAISIWGTTSLFYTFLNTTQYEQHQS